MSVADRLRSLFRPVEKSSLGTLQNPTEPFLELVGGRRTPSGERVTDSTAMCVSAVYACVRVIAEDVGKLPLNLWRRRKDGGRDPATDHPLYGILKRPNQHMTMQSFNMAQAAALGFRGNAISVILRDQYGRPTGLWPVHPGSVTLYEATDGSLFYSIARSGTLETAMLGSKPMMVPAYDVMHVKGLTFDGMVGLSPLAQMRATIGNAIAGEKLSGYMMANGASPSGVLVHPKQLSDPAARRLEKSWAERQSGLENAGKTPVLEEGMEWKAVGMSSVDAQFLEQRKFSIEEIARAFRVPLSMIGMLDRMTNNNASESTRSYYDQSLMPVLEAFEAEYSRAFDLPEDHFVEFEVSRLLRANFKARQEGNRMQVMGGSMTPNEWRLEEGRNPTPGGDVYARPLNTAFVDAEGNHVMTTPAGGKDPVVNDDDEPAGNAEEGAENVDQS
ncbi:phage portal protein [Nisaea nitritireducens]|uniref:phage portal protein n=1 Tax=Nisaea nitritireducens TaxID=568392 RepID=UPI0018667244|nr:phage portal protein [Nisaea nitritireducens]